MKPSPEMTDEERDRVKAVARDLLERLKSDKLVLDWRKRQRTRAGVRLCVEEVIDGLPTVYEEELYYQKCDTTYQHVFDSYFGQGRSVYSLAA